MGDRSSISFVNGPDESVALFNHWAGTSLFDVAYRYANDLCHELVTNSSPVGWPLDRLEPNTVMVDFIRWLVEKNEIHVTNRIRSSWYFGKDQHDGDNSDNGHEAINLAGIYADTKAAHERSKLMTATTATPKKKKTAAEWKAAKEMAAKITGYGNGSPIWGRTDVQVFTDIHDYLVSVRDGTGLFVDPLDQAITLIDELNKREAYKRLTATL